MANLDNIEEIKKLDPKDVFGSTGQFTRQCQQIHEVVEDQRFTKNYEGVENIIYAGLGGSAYGGHIAQSLFKDILRVPGYVNNDYQIPKFANENSLVIVTSYSGTTEEALSAYVDAKKKGARVVGLSTGGKLAELVKNGGDDAVVFDPKHNPSGQPRLGTGYIVLGTIEILRKTGILDMNSSEILEAISETDQNTTSIQERAKELAKSIFGNIPLIFAADFLAGNAHIIRNQFNETSKSFSSYHILSEANHHLLEGLKNPEGRSLISLFIESSFYPDRIKSRIELTQEVVGKNNVSSLSYICRNNSKLGQSFETLVFGSYLTFYLAILYGQDPSLIPWVDYFKDKLKD